MSHHLRRRLRGTSQIAAIEEFLFCSNQLNNYGLEIHKNLKISPSDLPTEIGVDASGILIRKNREMRLKWSQIAEFRYRENKFTINTKTKDKVILIAAASTHKGKCQHHRK